MNIMSKLTLRQMRMNRRRTIVTIVGVIISVAMFTAVATLSGSFIGFVQQMAIVQNGEYHVMYGGINADSLQLLEEEEEVESYYTVQSQGLAKLPEQFGAKRFLWIKAVSLDGMEAAGVKLTEGRLPQNNRELVLSESVRERDDTFLQIGDTVDLELGERRTIDLETGEEIFIDPNISYMGEEETFVTTSGDATQRYTIVGFATVYPLESSWMPCLTAITMQDNPNAENLDVFLKVKNVNNSFYDWADEMYYKLGATLSSTNTDLILSNGVDYDMDFMKMIYVLVGILFGIIFIGSVALIYNAFAISVTERSVNFGLLSSIGATNRQKRYSVLFEAFIILLIAVPLGLVGGILGMQGVFLIVNPSIASLMAESYEVNGLGLNVVVSPVAILIAVVLSVITVFVSAWIPAIRASRVTPMEAIRQQRDIQLTPKSVKTSWLTRKLFGFEGELAAKNMKRNKKRYRIAISSFVISLVLFLSASSFTHFLGTSVGVAIDDANYDLEVSFQQIPSPEEQDDSIDSLEEVEYGTTAERIADFNALATSIKKEIRTMEGVTESVVLQNWDDVTVVGEWLYESKSLQKLTDENADTAAAGIAPILRIFALDDDTLQTYCEQVGASYETMQNLDFPSAILINDLVWKEGRSYTNFSVYDLQKNDVLPFDCIEANTDEVTVQEGKLYLEAVTDKTVLGLSNQRDQNTGIVVDVIVSEAVLENYLKPMDETKAEQSGISIYLNADDSAKVEDRIWEVWEEKGDDRYNLAYYSVYNYTAQKQQIEQIVFLINTFSYVFIALISAIGVVNIFNTISTSIILRKREFAMLKSVGMTPRSFQKMLFFESLLYGIKSLLWGLPLSGVAMGLIFLTLQHSFNYAFSVPWLQVGIGIAGIFVIVLITVIYASLKVRKEGIIDGLRNRNL